MINVPPTPDHAEVDLGTAAGVTDRGLRHQRNEDSMALEWEQTPDGLVVVAVVGGGVSSSPRPDAASPAATSPCAGGSPVGPSGWPRQSPSRSSSPATTRWPAV